MIFRQELRTNNTQLKVLYIRDLTFKYKIQITKGSAYEI